MPIYEYQCNKCQVVKDFLLKYEGHPETMPCIETLDCKGVLVKQLGLRSKPLVADRDLIMARSHDGKK